MIKKLFSFFFDRSLLFFLIIGAANTLVSMIGSQLLLSSLGYWGSTALMFTLCSILSFLFNRRYSFRSTAPLLPSAVRFAVVIAVCYLVSFGVSDLLVPFAVRALALPISPEWITRIAMLLAQVIFTGLNYLGQRLWAFKS